MTVTRGTPTALANISRLHSDADGVATAFGEVQLADEHAVNIWMIIPINSSATAGTYDIYLLESTDGAAWTDGIDPASDADYIDYLKDAKLIHSASTIYDNSPTGSRTDVEFHWTGQIAEIAEYIGFVVVNNSGQSISASGADGDSVAVTFS